MAWRTRGSLLASVFMFALVAASAARAAQNCGEDLQNFQQKREAALQSINSLVTSAHGKQLDPIVFCARSQPLNAVENAMIGYMEKNKDWCAVPDEVIAQLKATHAKSISFATKACTVAAQMKKMKEQAAQGGANGAPQAQPLPAGPL